MPTMQYSFANKPYLGIEITSSAIRLAVLSGRKESRSTPLVKAISLPPDLVNENYLTPNIHDVDQIVNLIQASLSDLPTINLRRAALSLPDSVFRVQVLEFDELPSKPADRERLIRWRFEKSAFDISDTLLRHQVLKRLNTTGFSVLACVAKQSVISQYEDVLLRLGLEPWSIGLSSLHVLNFYEPYFAQLSPVTALAYVSENACTTIIKDPGGTFYRFKDVKKGRGEGVQARLTREIGDFLHYYRHMDRANKTEVKLLYLTGAGAYLPGLIEGIKEMTSLDVEVPEPSVIVSSLKGMGPEMAASLGAGYSL
jgi:Tfp pilus assembly PilM family ATPase